MSHSERNPEIPVVAKMLIQEYTRPFLEKLMRQGVIPQGTQVDIQIFPGLFTTPDFSFNRNTRIIEREGNKARLEPADGRFLGLLIDNEAHVVLHDEISQFMGRSGEYGSDSGKDSVYRIRKAMKKIGVSDPRRVIVAVGKSGYMLAQKQ